MPLPEVSVSREPMHTRAVRIDAFRRSDGAWDLEAELCDTKPFVTPLHSGPRAAGAPIHLMRLRLTIDTSYTVIDVAAVSDAVPYPGICDSITSPRKPFPLDRCHALRTDGPAVALYYPRWYRPEQAEAAFDEPPVSSKEQS